MTDSEPRAYDTDDCLNCGSRTSGTYCQVCGQSTATTRYSFNSLAREIYSKFRSIDAIATLRTFHALTVRPGHFAEEYLAGKRVGFTNPITYFFYYFVLEVGVLAFLQWATGDHTYGKQGTSGLHLQAASFVSTIFWGLLWWVFFRKSELNLIENVVAAIYFVAQVNLFSLALTIATAPLSKRFPEVQVLIIVLEAFLYFVYGLIFCRRLFRDSYWPLIPKQFALTLLHFVIVVGVVLFDIIGTAVLKSVAE